MEFNWPLSGDVVATLTVSKQIELDDVDVLSSYFEVAKKALTKAARASAAEAAKPQEGAVPSQPTVAGPSSGP
jgi:hypothetical protein